eukprot:9502345-Pyramimonas_sp.AAC.1
MPDDARMQMRACRRNSRSRGSACRHDSANTLQTVIRCIPPFSSLETLREQSVAGRVDAKRGASGRKATFRRRRSSARLSGS